ncbi:unnamed protein product [Prorocentrum cordatum]|uniref:Uncharacterized protein n=1 Tax=Prorocentrum cordatum TaxID=2364126 RepID=A0ABN9TUN1_9DINO|nr:unnamed protein product [Polarella glacialis]
MPAARPPLALTAVPSTIQSTSGALSPSRGTNAGTARVEHSRVLLEVQTIERRIVEIGRERRNDPALENQISAYVGSLAQQEVRSELATVGLRLRVSEAEVEAYRESVDEDFARARQFLHAEQQEYQQRIADARHEATVHIQAELNEYVVERDAALAAVGEIRVAESVIAAAEASLEVKAGEAEEALRGEAAELLGARDRLQDEWRQADAEVWRQQGRNAEDHAQLREEAQQLNLKLQEESEIAELARRRLAIRPKRMTVVFVKGLVRQVAAAQADADARVAAAQHAEVEYQRGADSARVNFFASQALHHTERDRYLEEIAEVQTEARVLRAENAALAEAAQELVQLQSAEVQGDVQLDAEDEDEDFDFASHRPAYHQPPPGLPARPAALSSSPPPDAGVAGAMLAFMEQMAEQQRAGAEEQRALLVGLTRAQENLAEAQRESASKLKPAKPVLTASDAATLKVQLEKFKIYQNDSLQASKAIRIEGARAIAEGTAKIEMEDLIVTELGGEDAYQALLKERSNPRWEAIWIKYVRRLKVAVHLGDEREANEAVRMYSRLSLAKDASIDAVAKFLNEYTAVRTDMINHGLLTDVPLKRYMKKGAKFVDYEKDQEIDGKDCQKETKKRAEDQAPARTATTKKRAEDQAPARTATTKKRVEDQTQARTASFKSAEDQAPARTAAATSTEDQVQARNATNSVEDQTQDLQIEVRDAPQWNFPGDGEEMKVISKFSLRLAHFKKRCHRLKACKKMLGRRSRQIFVSGPLAGVTFGIEVHGASDYELHSYRQATGADLTPPSGQRSPSRLLRLGRDLTVPEKVRPLSANADVSDPEQMPMWSWDIFQRLGCLGRFGARRGSSKCRAECC